mmetsp:Transcript_135431/g.260197  ORF Transcript_135431/g.260197 Transcript_135431/m.260197 type:complete len:166 (+) Transcript_135431:75-572(+)
MQHIAMQATPWTALIMLMLLHLLVVILQGCGNCDGFQDPECDYCPEGSSGEGCLTASDSSGRRLGWHSEHHSSGRHLIDTRTWVADPLCGSVRGKGACKSGYEMVTPLKQDCGKSVGGDKIYCTCCMQNESVTVITVNDGEMLSRTWKVAPRVWLCLVMLTMVLT